MTRSFKLNDRDHVGLADGTAAPEEHLPRYFAKSGHANTDPKKTKKEGAGKGNWGRSGEEYQDYGFNVNNPRRRSNSSSQAVSEFKTKFETIDPEPVFEEDLHGPGPMERVTTIDSDETGRRSSVDTTEKDSMSTASIEEELDVKKSD